MKKSRFTEERMVQLLREADRTSVAEAAKKHKVSDATIYAWRIALLPPTPSQRRVASGGSMASWSGMFRGRSVKCAQ